MPLSQSARAVKNTEVSPDPFQCSTARVSRSTNHVFAHFSDWPFGHGLGLFATKPIKRGVYIATYRGRRTTTEEADRREIRGAKYQFELNKRWTIDGSPRWNVARYINHSCRPNAKPVGRRGGIVIVALRQIEPGEEITYDYGRRR
jgi:SET domain-containing protein